MGTMYMMYNVQIVHDLHCTKYTVIHCTIIHARMLGQFSRPAHMSTTNAHAF